MRKLRFPGCFKLGSNILEEFEAQANCFGRKFVFVGGKRAIASAKEKLEKSFEGTQSTYEFVECGKIATPAEIDRVAAIPCVQEADVLCGVGGGSAMDVVRTVGNRNGQNLVMIPTTIASDAPCSSVSVFYSEDGTSVVGDQLFHKSPELVIVDSDIIATAPTRHIAAGMGDGLATYYEAMTNKLNPHGTEIAKTGMLLAGLARKIILEDGLDAYEAVKTHVVTPALENVIEANCFLSGVGGANTGCAEAHGIGDFLGQIPGGHEFMHGERVYVGLMVQLILEQYPKEELVSFMKFGRKVGLPVCLGDLCVMDVKATAKELAEGLVDDHFMVNLCCDHSISRVTGAFVQAQNVADALQEVEE